MIKLLCSALALKGVKGLIKLGLSGKTRAPVGKGSQGFGFRSCLAELCIGQWVPIGLIELVQLFFTTHLELVSAQPHQTHARNVGNSS